MHRGGAVAELGRSDGQFEPAVLTQRNQASAIWPSGGTVSIMVSAMPSPISQSAEVDFGAVGLHRALDQIEALVEPVGAIEHVVMPEPGGDSMGSPGLTILRRRISNGLDAEPLGQFVDRGLDREQRLRQAIAAKGAGRHRVGVGDDGVDLLVGQL